MTLFTDNPFEKMMIQKPDGRRDNAPPVPYPPACASCEKSVFLFLCPKYGSDCLRHTGLFCDN